LPSVTTFFNRRISMKVFAIGSIVKPPTEEQKQQVMPKEVPHTLKLYLEGKLEQFWFRQDIPGTFFLFDVESTDEAKKILEAMPIVTGGFLKYEVYPVGPLAPLGLLLQPR
jgi:muconolactone delta-isomerase